MSLSRIYGAQFSSRQNVLSPQLVENTSRKPPTGVHFINEEEPFCSGSGASNDIVGRQVQKSVEDLHDSDPYVSGIAAWTLIGTGKEAVPELAKVLSLDKNPDVRKDAAWALGKIGEKAGEAVPELAKALGEDKDPDVRQNAAWALGKIGEKEGEAVPALAKALGEDKDPDVRQNAALALGRMRKKAEKAVPELAKALSDKNLHVRFNALVALEKIEAIPELVKALSDENLGTNAENALLRIGEEAIPELAKALSDKNPLVSSAADRIIVEIGRHGNSYAVINELVKHSRES